MRDIVTASFWRRLSAEGANPESPPPSKVRARVKNELMALYRKGVEVSLLDDQKQCLKEIQQEHNLFFFRPRRRDSKCYWTAIPDPLLPIPVPSPSTTSPLSVRDPTVLSSPAPTVPARLWVVVDRRTRRNAPANTDRREGDTQTAPDRRAATLVTESTRFHFSCEQYGSSSFRRGGTPSLAAAGEQCSFRTG